MHSSGFLKPLSHLYVSDQGVAPMLGGQGWGCGIREVWLQPPFLSSTVGLEALVSLESKGLVLRNP
jgi:hypothetical protein